MKRRQRSKNPSCLSFNPTEYLKIIHQTCNFIKQNLPSGFKPYVALTLGSGGLGEIANEIEKIATIPYQEIPGFKVTTVEGHPCNLIAGHLEGVPIIGLQGRCHYYEEGGQPNQVIAPKDITFPIDDNMWFFAYHQHHCRRWNKCHLT